MRLLRGGYRRAARSAVALGAGLVIASGCATTPDLASGAALGCWYFVEDAATAVSGLPWGVRLTDDPIEGWPALESLDGVRRATTLEPDGERDFPFGYWRPLAQGDSLYLGYPAGGGFAVNVGMAEDSEDGGRALAGTVRAVGDALPMGEDRPGAQAVRLVWGRCP